MKISFAICTHNEGDAINRLTMKLRSFIEQWTTMDNKYEIVIVDDFSEDEGTLGLLALLEALNEVTVYEHALNGDFAAHKNFMTGKCTGDWILNLDADELVSDSLLEILPTLVEHNPLVEAYWLPRVNTVEGLTLKHVQKWGWTLSKLPGYRTAEMLDPTSAVYDLLKQFQLIESEENGLVVYNKPIICWPDPQMRFYKNDPKLQWEGKVHERLVGYDNYSMLPHDPDFAILHFKDITRQEKQNTFYETIQR
jgi:glycosyltransferase involved in cell wall biosynthesis